MIKVNILITAVGGDIGGNIVNILAEQKNILFNIIGTDLNPNVFSIHKINQFYQVDKVENLNYKNQIIQIIRDNDIQIVLPLSEKEILWFSKNKTLFSNLNIKIMINDDMILNNFFDKFKTSQLLNNISIKTPQTYLFHEFNSQIDFPLILKSKYSIVSKDIFIIKNKNQLDYLNISIENKNDYVIQEYVGSYDEEYTTAIYQSNNKLEVISFKRKLTGGMTSSASIVNEEILKNYATQIAKSFDLKGSINIQSRKVDNDFYIFEINPRLSSTVYIRNYFGFQDLLWWIEDILKLKFLNNTQPVINSCGSSLLGYQYTFFKE
jgi:carbamoyl-phosphate synthase large subunit